MKGRWPHAGAQSFSTSTRALPGWLGSARLVLYLREHSLTGLLPRTTTGQVPSFNVRSFCLCGREPCSAAVASHLVIHVLSW